MLVVVGDEVGHKATLKALCVEYFRLLLSRIEAGNALGIVRRGSVAFNAEENIALGVSC